MALAKISQTRTRQAQRNGTDGTEFKGTTQLAPEAGLAEPFGWPYQAIRLTWLCLMAGLTEPFSQPYPTSLADLALPLSQSHLAPRPTNLAGPQVELFHRLLHL